MGTRSLPTVTREHVAWAMAIPAKLNQQLALGHVVPFVGSGVSLAVRVEGQAVFPSWSGLLAEMANALDNDKTRFLLIVNSL